MSWGLGWVALKPQEIPRAMSMGGLSHPRGGDGGASSAPRVSASRNGDSQVSRGALSLGRMRRHHLVWDLDVLFPVSGGSVCISLRKLHLLHWVCPSFPQACVQSCPGYFAIHDTNVTPSNATAFSALSAFPRVYFPRDLEIYHLEGRAQKAGFIAQKPGKPDF